jgi:hypothetical protein
MPRTVLLCVVLAAVCVMSSDAAPAAPPDLVGTYRCDGKNPDGSAYRGIVEIAKVRDTFRVKWTLDDSAVIGVGIFSNDVFAVSYFGGAPAVVVYKLNGTNLVGEWTMGGIEGAVYTETLTKTSSEAPTPELPRRQEPGRQDRNRPSTPASGGGMQL